MCGERVKKSMKERKQSMPRKINTCEACVIFTACRCSRVTLADGRNGALSYRFGLMVLHSLMGGTMFRVTSSSRILHRWA